MKTDNLRSTESPAIDFNIEIRLDAVNGIFRGYHVYIDGIFCYQYSGYNWKGLKEVIKNVGEDIYNNDFPTHVLNSK